MTTELNMRLTQWQLWDLRKKLMISDLCSMRNLDSITTIKARLQAIEIKSTERKEILLALKEILPTSQTRDIRLERTSTTYHTKLQN